MPGLTVVDGFGGGFPQAAPSAACVRSGANAQPQPAAARKPIVVKPPEAAAESKPVVVAKVTPPETIRHVRTAERQAEGAGPPQKTAAVAPPTDRRGERLRRRARLGARLRREPSRPR